MPLVCALQALGVVGDKLAEDFVEADGDVPGGIVRLELGKVRDVADVIALAVFLGVLPVQFIPRHLLNFAYSLEHRNAVFSAAAEIVDLPTTRFGGKLFNGTDHIVAVNVVADLLAFIAEYVVGPARNGHLHQVGKEAVKLDTRM